MNDELFRRLCELSFTEDVMRRGDAWSLTTTKALLPGLLPTPGCGIVIGFADTGHLDAHGDRPAYVPMPSRDEIAEQLQVLHLHGKVQVEAQDTIMIAYSEYSQLRGRVGIWISVRGGPDVNDREIARHFEDQARMIGTRQSSLADPDVAVLIEGEAAFADYVRFVGQTTSDVHRRIDGLMKMVARVLDDRLYVEASPWYTDVYDGIVTLGNGRWQTHGGGMRYPAVVRVGEGALCAVTHNDEVVSVIKRHSDTVYVPELTSNPSAWGDVQHRLIPLIKLKGDDIIR